MKQKLYRVSEEECFRWDRTNERFEEHQAFVEGELYFSAKKEALKDFKARLYYLTDNTSVILDEFEIDVAQKIKINSITQRELIELLEIDDLNDVDYNAVTCKCRYKGKIYKEF